jgi:hypothetical protein
MHLPNRHYLLKVRGEREPELTYTPEYIGRWELVAATHRATLSRRVPLVSAELLNAELAWRSQWLEATFKPQKGGGKQQQTDGSYEEERSTDAAQAGHISSGRPTALGNGSFSAEAADTDA